MIKPNFPILDPKKPETWGNRRAPVDVAPLQKLIDAEFGTIPGGYGEMSGKPLYKIVWGQEHKQFERGKMRLAFDDDRIPAIIEHNHYAVTPEVYARALVWLKTQEELRFEAFKSANWTAFGKLPDISDYLEASESPLDYFALPKTAGEREIVRLLPPNWRYFPGLRIYNETGIQAFIILKWMPPQTFGTPHDWDGARFQIVYVPEANCEMLIDTVGDFPRHGLYSVFVKRIAREIDDENYEYREPNEHNTIEFLRQKLWIQKKKNELARQKMINVPEMNEQLRQEQKGKAEAAADAYFDDAFADAMPSNKIISI